MSAGPRPLRVVVAAAGEIWGGIEQFVLNDAVRLHDAGSLALVLLFFQGPLYFRLRQAGLPVVVVRSRSRIDLGALGEIRRLLRQHHATLVHVHGYKAAILAGIVARLAGIPVVRTEHGRLEPGRGFGQWKMRANVVADRLLAPITVDGVAYVSRDVEHAKHRSYPNAVSRLIHNGIQTERRGRGALPAGIDRSRFNVGIIGRVSPVKGHRYLVEALRLLHHLPDLTVHVVGDGPDLDACVAESADLVRTGRIRFHGFRDNVSDYVTAFDLVVMPSLREGLPYTLLEAMSSGIPVVASAVGGLAEVIAHQVDGYLVPPCDAAALAGAIDELYRSSALRRRLAENAARKVSDEYSLRRQASSYEALYRDVLEGAR